MLTLLALSACVTAAPPEVKVTGDDTKITESCTIVIPPGTIIKDANNDGVIHIDADNIEVVFAPGSDLRGAEAPDATGSGGVPWDELTGIGISIDGHKGVTIRGPRVHGYKIGLHARKADGITIEGGEFSDYYRMHLRSTPQGEDGGDWLWPHRNEKHEWALNYGAAIWLDDLENATVSGVKARRGQNGIVLDQVNRSKLFDNDVSFLTGWGVAMWRASDNHVTRNAIDFCVRGYSHKVYNRGQDSAGILMFEQCNRNVIAENSITHGGDGFFGFAGREAIGEVWAEREHRRLRRDLDESGIAAAREKLAAERGEDWKDAGKHGDDQVVDALMTLTPEVLAKFKRLGCNDNLLIANDLSYAPAHGIEMTFSHGNVFAKNRLVENAICGVWGGYSQDTLITENTFEGNGLGGGESGGINIEHGSGNLVLNNAFRRNSVGVAFWWDNDAGLLKMPGVQANYRGVSANVVANNRFEDNRVNDKTAAVNFRLRDGGGELKPGEKPRVFDNLFVDNKVFGDGGNSYEPLTLVPATEGKVPEAKVPEYKVYGTSQPVGARRELRGRENIIMGEWGPWDHESTLFRRGSSEQGGARQVYEVFGKGSVAASALSEGTDLRVERAPDSVGAPTKVSVIGREGEVTPYRVQIQGDGWQQEVSGLIIATEWKLTTFSWHPESSDPRKDLAAWRAVAKSDRAFYATVPGIDFSFGGFGPREQKWSKEISEFGPRGDRFGVIATTKINLPEGKWKFKTLSDDGVRVMVDNVPVIERWNWHAPERDEAIYTQTSTRPIEITVEYFEIDGHAVLTLEIEPVK